METRATFPAILFGIVGKTGGEGESQWRRNDLQGRRQRDKGEATKLVLHS